MRGYFNGQQHHFTAAMGAVQYKLKVALVNLIKQLQIEMLSS
jgi:hypothetical protein